MSGDAFNQALDQLAEHLTAALDSVRELSRLARDRLVPAADGARAASTLHEGGVETYGELWQRCLIGALPRLPKGPPAFWADPQRTLSKPYTLETLVRGLGPYVNNKNHTCTPKSSEELAKDLKISKASVQDGLNYLRATGWLQKPKDNKRSLGKSWKRLTYKMEVPSQFLPPEDRPRLKIHRPEPDEVEVEQLGLEHQLGPPGQALPEPIHHGPPTGRSGAPAGGLALNEGSTGAGYHPADAGMGSGSRSDSVGIGSHIASMATRDTGQQHEVAGMLAGYQTTFDSLLCGQQGEERGLAARAVALAETGQQDRMADDWQADTARLTREAGYDPGAAGTLPGQHLSTRVRAGAFPLEGLTTYLLLLLADDTSREAEEKEDVASLDGKKKTAQAAMRLLAREWLEAGLASGAPPLPAKPQVGWVPLVEHGLVPLIDEFDNPAWRRKGERHPIPWDERVPVWKLALRFLRRGQSVDPESAVKYALTRVDAPVPGTEHSQIRDSGYEGGREQRAPDPPVTAAPLYTAGSKWKADNPDELVKLQEAARGKLGDDARESMVLIEVETLIAALLAGKTSVAEICAAEERRREARLQAAAKLLQIHGESADAADD